MRSAPLPPNEADRLAALQRYQILDTAPEADFDDLTRLAAQICGTPIALISLADAHRQWFKSRFGLGSSETPRDVAFCAHAILQPHELFIVSDSHQDERFQDNPLVTGEPNIRFYAGAPLVTPDQQTLGMLCVVDHIPHALTPAQCDALRVLGRLVIVQLEQRLKIRELEEALGAREQFAVALSESQTRLNLLNTISTGVISGALLSEVIEQTVSVVARAFPDLHTSYATISMEGMFSILYTVVPAGIPKPPRITLDLNIAPEYLQPPMRAWRRSPQSLWRTAPAPCCSYPSVCRMKSAH